MRPYFPPLAFLLVSRLVLLLYSAVAYRLVPVLEGRETWDAFHRGHWLNAWARWDAGWYVSVAERGYEYIPDAQSNVAFFPLYPLLIRAAGLLGLGSYLAGWFIANLAFLAAGLLFWRLTEARLDHAAAHRGLLWLTVFPYAFFFSAVYPEALFLLGAVGAFWAAEGGRWGLATLWGALAALTDPFGILLLPALVAFRLQRSRTARDFLGFLAIPAMPALFLAYLGWAFGSPWVFVEAHVTGWHVGPELPLARSLAKAAAVALAGFKLGTPDHLAAILILALEVAFLVLVWPIWRRLGAPYGLYTALSLVLGLVFAGDAIGRHLAGVFPAFMLAGALDRGGAVTDGLALLSFTLQLLLLALFASWRWVA